MTSKKDTARRAGRVARPQKTPDRSDAPTVGLGQRLRASRESAGLSRKQSAAELGWSESRLISYESDATQPNVSEITLLASVYGRDRAWLAFGDAFQMLSGARASSPQAGVWLPMLEGSELSVPASLVSGVPGPFVCAVAGERTGLGLSPGDVLVAQPKAVPTQHALWVVNSEGDVRVGWLGSTSRTVVQVRLDLAGGFVSVATPHLVGRVVATMQRVAVAGAVGGSPRDARKRR